jgi:hypothetical protein
MTTADVVIALMMVMPLNALGALDLDGVRLQRLMTGFDLRGFGFDDDWFWFELRR